MAFYLPGLQTLNDRKPCSKRGEEFLRLARDSSLLLTVEEGGLLNSVESLIQLIRLVYHKLFSYFKRSIYVNWASRRNLDRLISLQTPKTQIDNLMFLKKIFYKISFEYKFIKNCLYSFLRENLFYLYVEKISLGSIFFSFQSGLNDFEQRFLGSGKTGSHAGSGALDSRFGFDQKGENSDHVFSDSIEKLERKSGDNSRIGINALEEKKDFLVRSVVKIVSINHLLFRKKFEKFLFDHNLQKKGDSERYAAGKLTESGCSYSLGFLIDKAEIKNHMLVNLPVYLNRAIKFTTENQDNGFDFQSQEFEIILDPGQFVEITKRSFVHERYINVIMIKVNKVTADIREK